MAETNGRVRISTPVLYVLLAIVGYAISGWVGYAAASSAISSRVSVLEAQRLETERRLTSIEAKIDQLLLRSR